MALVDQYEGLTAAAVLAMRGDVENRQLDCKLVANAGLTERPDKVNLAAALSGFSNADGGLILWGVSARKNDDGVDCIVGHPGIGDPRRLVARLEELTPQAVSPGIVGVAHRALHGEGASPSFVVTFVPQSDAGPHMARLGEDRYYQRIGACTLRMEHRQLADMFGRRARPEMEIKAEQEGGANLIVLRLRNVGRGIARAPYVMLRPGGPYITAPYPRTGKAQDFPLPLLVTGSVPDWGAFVGDMNHVLHPGVALHFRAVSLPNAWSGTPPEICTVAYRIGAVGTAERSGEFTCNFGTGRVTANGSGYSSD